VTFKIIKMITYILCPTWLVNPKPTFNMDRKFVQFEDECFSIRFY
jgi:hypothetical protein